jgi:hypothetical protein
MWAVWLSQKPGAMVSHKICLQRYFRHPSYWSSSWSAGFYLTFFPEIDSAGFPARGLAAAEALGFSCFGFLASLLPRMLLPLAMVGPSNMQPSNAGMAGLGCGLFSDLY